MASIPTYVAKGAFTSGTGAITPAIPTGYLNDDILILVVESANQAITAPSGWTELGSQATQSTGTAAAAGGVRLGVFWKVAGGLEAAPSVADTGDHTTGMIFAVRGADTTNPFHNFSGSAAAASTSMTWPTFTTTEDNTLILMLTAVDTDAASTTTVGAITAANLASITEFEDNSVIAGAGGGLHAAWATKATAGALGTITATASTSVTHAYLTVAVRGDEPKIRTVGQYKNDQTTIVPVGGATGTDGISNEIFLKAEYSAGNRYVATTPKYEKDTVATGFSGTADASMRDMIQVDGTNPARALRGATMIYDDVNKRLVYFGGYDGTTRYNEVWHRFIDKPGQPWRKMAPTGTPPTGRNLHGSTFLKANLTSGGATRAYMMVWGGFSTADQNDMYLLRLDTVGSEAWTTITQTTPPTAREYMNNHIVATPGPNSHSAYVYLFGGWATNREDQLVRCTVDVDAPTAVTWTTLKATGAVGNPGIRTGAILAYKASTSKLYLYGGYNGTTMLNDFWEYDIAGNTWTNTSPTGTAPTASETAVGGYDAVNNRFWFTGGWTTNGTFTTGLNQIGYISNVGATEAYNIVRANTTNTGNQTYVGNSFGAAAIVPDKNFLYIKQGANCEPSATDMERYGYIIDFNEGVSSGYPVYGENDGEFNTARDAPAGIVDPVTNEWLMIGGFDDMYNDTTIINGTHSNDIWAYNPTTNSWRYANAGWKGLPPMEGRTIVYDSTRDRFLLWGGLTAIGLNSNEVWSLTRDSNNEYVAAPLYPTGTPPADRWLSAVVYDPTNDRLIIAMGGDNAGTQSSVNSLSFTGSADGAWTTLTPTGSPTAVIGMGFANKASAKRLYIFGGATNSPLTTVSSQLAYLDYSTTNCAWTVVTTTGAVARRTPALAYDEGMDRLVVFGGFNGTNSIQALGYLNLATTVWEVPTISGSVPDARRSGIAAFINGVYYLTHGRSDSGMWYRNTWKLQPDYVTINNSVWTVNPYADSYTPVYYNVTGLTTSTGYHWQAWITQNSVDSVKDSYPSALNVGITTHYFNASDNAVLDPGSAWTNDANAVDGSTGTKATSTTAGSTSSNYLMSEGTTAVDDGTIPISVRARVYRDPTTAGGTINVSTQIYTDGLGASLGTLTATSTSTGWGAYTTLTEPTGGWSWRKLQTLEFKHYINSVSSVTEGLSRVELEVTSITTKGVTANAETVNDFYVGSPSVSSPTVTSGVATDIDLGVATVNGNVTADGNGAITERGFVLALQASADPTTGTNVQKVTVTGTTGAFARQFTNLDPNTAYKFRAYAINSNGTSYGSAVNFTSADYKTFTAYAVMQNTGGGRTYLTLWNRTDGTQVYESEMATSSASPVLIKKQFAYNAGNFGDGKDYEFRMKVSGGTGNVYSAGLYVKLHNLTKATTYNRVSRFGFQALSGAAAATTQRFLYTAGNYSSPTADWVVTGTEDTNGTNNFQLYNVTTTDSGTTGSGVGSGIDVNSIAKTWATTTGVSLVDTNRYIGIFNFTSGGARYHQGLLAITASGAANTVENATQIELLDTARSSVLGVNYEPDASRTPFMTDHFDGATYYFETVSTNSNVSNAYGTTLVAYNAAGTATDVVTVNSAANTGASNVRNRSASITIPTDTVELRVRIAGTAAAKNVVLGGARVIAVQTNATKTLVHIPMGGSNNESNDDAIWPIVSTAQTTYATLATNVDQFTIWRRDDTKFADYYEINSTPQYTKTHTTSANMKRQNLTVAHTTSSNRKKSFSIAHTTSSYLKHGKSHTTDALKTIGTTNVTNTYYVSSSADDAWENLTGTVVINGTGNGTGEKFDRDNHLGFRFPNVTIPQGTTITAAYFRLPQLWNYSGFSNILGSVYAEKVANSAQFTTTAGDITNRTKTTAKVTNPGADQSPWTTGNSNLGLDITAVMQEVFNQGTWASGNATSVLLIGDETGATTQFIQPYMWDYTTGFYRAELRIVTTTPAAREFRKQHTTDAYKAIAVPSYTRTHTTDANKRKATTVTHTTDANKKKSGTTLSHTTSSNLKKSGLTRTHTTDANKRVSGITRTHTTDALKRKATTVSYTTSANKRLATTKTHTTDANKKKATTVFHTTNANLKKSGITRTHTTDANKRTTGLTRTHTTDANKRKTGLTVSHTTDAYLRPNLATYTRTHTTDALKRKQTTVTHTTDALKRKQTTVTHTTDALKRKQNTLTHTTDALKRKQNTVSHTTSANKRLATVKTHTTDANKRVSGITRSHTTDSFLRKQNTRTHTTDANRRKATTVTHTTDANKKKSGFTVSHTTSANKRVTGLTVFHTTSANKKKASNTLSHTTDANKKKASLTLTHTTDALKTFPLAETLVDNFNDNSLDTGLWSSYDAGGLPFSRLAETNSRLEMEVGSSATGVLDAAGLQGLRYYSLVGSFVRAKIVSATGAANRYGNMYFLVSGGTSPRWSYNNGQLLAQSTPNGGTSPTTYATLTYNSTTHAYWRIREASGVFYWDTSSDGSNWTNQYNGTPTGFTSPVKGNVGFEAGATGSGAGLTFYIDDINIGKQTLTRTHTTDALKRKQSTLTHTTDALKKVAGLTRSHTTDALKRTQSTRTHTTDALKRKQNTLTHTTSANKKLATTKTHTTDANKKVAGITRSHTTNSLLRRQLTLTHTTSANKRKTTTVSHTTDASKKTVPTKTHTTDAYKSTTATVGWNNPATASFSADGFDGWSNPNNIFASDDAYATATMGINASWTNFLIATNFGFSIPVGSTINGIQMSFERKGGASAVDRSIRIVKGGSYVGTDKSAGASWGTTDSYATYGTTSDLWGTTWTVADINASNFGVAIQAGSAGGFVNASVDHVRMMVTYTPGIPQYTKTHSTDALKRKATTVTHTTDANKKKSGFTVSHTTSANKMTQTVVTIYPTLDGTVLRTGVDETFTTIRNGSGNSFANSNASDATQLASSATSNQYSTLTRGIFTFDTSAIPLDAIINSVTLSLYGQSKANFLGTAPDLHIAGATPASTSTLANSDYGNVQRTSFGNIAYASFSTAGYNDFVLNSSGKAAINKGGYTSFSAQNAWDLNNSFTGSWSTSSPQVYSYYMSEQTGTSQDPKLVISWSLPPLVRHTTDALKRKATTVSHTTSSNKRLATTVSHTTSANKKKSGFTVSHTTDAYKLVSTSSGPNSPTSGTNVTSFGTIAWSNPGNILSSDNSYADASQAVSGGNSNYLRGSGFGFSLPSSATVRGIKVEIEKKASSAGIANFVQDARVRIVKSDGSVGTTEKADTVTKWPTTDAYVTYGGAADLWGETWAYTDINDTDFGAVISANLTVDTTVSAFVDHMRITVYYTTPNVSYTRTHTTDAFLRSQFTRTHTTDALKRKATTVSHTTDANKKKANNTVSHTTDANKRIAAITRSHTTDAFLRRQITKTHTTDALKRTLNTRTHTTDALKRTQNTRSHTTDANKKKAGNTVFHTTSANKRVAGNTRSHTTDALKRTLNTRSHTTDALKRTQNTRSHTTDTLLRRQLTRTHTTDANKKRANNVVTHTTDANKKKANNTVSHTTNALLRKLFTVAHTTNALLRKQGTVAHTTNSFLRKQSTLSHTTDANKRVAGNTRFHTTDANKKKANNVVSHTTDALKRTLNTRSHTTNSFIRRQLTLTHTTNSFLRRQITLSHTTSANKRRATTVTHTTDANKRRLTTVSHTTDALKKKAGLTLSHTTDAFKRTQNTRSHTTNSFLRRQIALTHTTDSFRRSGNQLTHTTDANKKRANNTLSHTTDANKRKTGLTVSHTTNAFLRRRLTLAHTTDALKRSLNTRTHTTDAFKRTRNVLTHTTDSLKRKGTTIFHTADANLRRAYTILHTTSANKRKSGNLVSHTTDANKRKSNNLVSHTTDANKRKTGLTVSHTTDALLRRSLTLTHTTDAFKRTLNSLSHTTDSLLRRAVALTHTTDSNKRRATTVSHTTSSNLRKLFSVFHTTDANKKRAANTVSHTTDANKRVAGNLVSHTTNALKRTLNTLSHSTSSFLRKAQTVAHTTNSLLRKTNTVSHATDANKRKVTTVSHTTSANKRKAGNLVSHTTNALKRKQNVLSHTTDAFKKTRNTVAHTTNALLRRLLTLTHTTNSFLRKANTVSHTTSANKRLAGNIVSHTTDANKKRSANTVSHTTNSFLRKANVVSHTTSANKKRAQSVSHTTDANKKKPSNIVSHLTDAFLRGANQVVHNTDANKRKAGNTRSHSTDASLKMILTRSHTTNALLRRAVAITHTTNAFLRRRVTASHTTDANLKKAYTKSHTTNAMLRGGNERFHTTDANKRRASIVSHSTSANLRKPINLAHTTDSFLRRRISLSHTTDSFLRKARSVFHTTSANMRKASVVSHSTDANKRRSDNTVSHTTSSSLKQRWALSHSTDAFLRKQRSVSHSTSANLKRGQIVSHSTDASLFTAHQVIHSTDAYLFAERGNKKVLVDGVWVYGTVKILVGGVWVVKPLYVLQGGVWVLSEQ